MTMAQPSFPRRPDDVVIVSAVRTPLTRSRKGSLASVPPATLLSVALRGCIARVSPGITPADVDDVCVGNVLSPPSGAAAFRMAQFVAGFPDRCSLSVVNRQCSSGLQAIANVANAIAAGDVSVGIGCGVESMSKNPMNKMTPPDVEWDVMNKVPEAMDCLTPMGITSENVTKRYGLTRARLDAFAAESHRKASEARRSGKFKEEIVPVGSVTEDDGIRPTTTASKLAKLKPVFDPENGSTTAGNSSQTTDGAAAVLLTTRSEAERRGLDVLGVWRGYAVRGVPPDIMGIGPAVAIPAVLGKLNLSKDDVDVYEINEAFASQASWCVEKLNLDERKVNPNGGAIALGHPLGCTGSRMVATLLHELRRRGGGGLGLVSMCVGTGMGAAAVLQVEADGGNAGQVISRL